MKTSSSFLICAIAAVSAWALFFPANMNPDSIAQYQQAVSGQFNDWHPPAPAVILSAIMTCRGDIGLLMFFQCLAGVVGLRQFAYELIGEWEGRGAMTSAARSRWATLVVLLFLLPISPFPFYVMTFSKDAWMMILLLWVGALAFRLQGGGMKPGSPAFIAGYLALLGLAGLAPYVRHNATLLLGPLGLVSLMTTRRIGPRWSWLSAVLSIAACLLWHPVFHGTISVSATHPSTQVKALNLIGICVLDPDARAPTWSTPPPASPPTIGRGIASGTMRRSTSTSRRS